MSLSKVAFKLREQMCSFLGNLRLSKPARRFVLEALYGIVSRQSVMLTEIGRSLNESIPLIKTENRLSRQAARKGLWEAVTQFVIEQGAERVKKDTLLIVDPSDIAKPYAEKMEYLARVRDGSEGKLADGYWLCQVMAVECGGNEIVPLVNHLWSQEAPEFESENAEILGCIDRVSEATEGRGIWVYDRGGDRIKLIRPLLEREQQFIIRQVGNRDVVWNRQKRRVRDVAAGCTTPYAETLRRQNLDGTETIRTITFGFRRVKLPDRREPLSLVVIRGFGQEPTMLLTTVDVRGGRKKLWWVVQAYLTRWRIEETLRYAKQKYDIENIRVLGYESLRNLMAMVLLVMYFSMVYLGQQAKLAVLAHHTLCAAKRLFGIPDFWYYAVADGLREILFGRQTRPFRFPTKRRDGPFIQLDFLHLAEP